MDQYLRLDFWLFWTLVQSRSRDEKKPRKDPKGNPRCFSAHKTLIRISFWAHISRWSVSPSVRPFVCTVVSWSLLRCFGLFLGAVVPLLVPWSLRGYRGLFVTPTEIRFLVPLFLSCRERAAPWKYPRKVTRKKEK